MPLSSALVGRKTRRFRHAVDARWLMAYAAALGETAPCYFDTRQVVIGHPLFPVCVEWPVVLDTRQLEGSRSLTPAEAARGVHATHDVILHRPFAAGMEVFSSATIAAVEARSAGAYQMTRLDTVAADGNPLATTWQGSLYRGVTVDGADRSVASAPPLPSREGATVDGAVFDVAVTAGAAHTYSECARIWNPIHTDKRVALAAGLPDIILHGTATLALAVSTLIRVRLDDDPRRVRRIAARFSGVVLMPEILTVCIDAVTSDAMFFSVRSAAGNEVIRDGVLMAGDPVD